MITLFFIINSFISCFAFRHYTYPKLITKRHLSTNPIDLIQQGNVGKEWTYFDLLTEVKKNNVESATVLSNYNSILTIDKSNVSPDNVHVIKTVPSLTDLIVDLLSKNNIHFNVSTWKLVSLTDFIPTPVYYVVGYVLFISFLNFMMKKNGAMNQFGNFFDNSPSEVNIEDIEETFEDVAGCDEAKYELEEIVDFLKNSEKYTTMGASVPKGLLLEGPPGTGKTLLARAVAGEAKVKFLYASGSQFIEMFVGVGASRVRKLFETARENKPCIIFIDEIDAVGRQRGAGLAGGNDEREQTLNQILTNMDGFSKEDGIIVLAATNRADILDSALTRPGRFDRKVKVGLPDEFGRKSIMDVHLKNKKLENSVNLKEISALTSGFSGADLYNLINEAAIYSVRYNQTSINQKSLLDAFEKITIGLPKKTETRSAKVQEMVAFHETGHTITAMLFQDFFDVRKVTIQSNLNGAGGYTLFTPKDQYSNFPTKKFILANMIVAMGGRAAEVYSFKSSNNETYLNYHNEAVFSEFKDLDITTGASNDLKQVNSLARRFVSLYGLGTNIGLYDSSDPSQPFLGRELATNQNKISEYTKQQIELEVEKLVKFSFDTALKIIESNQVEYKHICSLLLQKRTITQDDLIPIRITMC